MPPSFATVAFVLLFSHMFYKQAIFINLFEPEDRVLSWIADLSSKFECSYTLISEI